MARWLRAHPLFTTLFFAVFLLGAGMRFTALDQMPPGLYHDEIFYGIDAADALTTGDFKIFYPANNGRGAMFITLLAGAVALFGDTIDALRGASAAIGSLSLIATYLLALELFRHDAARKNIALLGMFLVAVSYWHLNFSRIAFDGITVPLLQGAGMWLLLVAIRTRRIGVYAGAGALLALGFYSYAAYPAFMPLVLYILWRAYRDGKMSVQHGMVLLAAGAIVIAPLAYWVLAHPELFFQRSHEVSVWSIPLEKDQDTPLVRSLVSMLLFVMNSVQMALMPFVSGDANWRHNYNAQPALALLAMLGVALAFYFYRKEKKSNSSAISPLRLLALWVLLAALPAILSSEGMPHSLRGIGMLLPLHLLAAWGLWQCWLALRLRFKPMAVTLAVLLLAGTAISTNYTYFVLWKHHPETKKAFLFEKELFNDYDLTAYDYLKPYR